MRPGRLRLRGRRAPRGRLCCARLPCRPQPCRHLPGVVLRIQIRLVMQQLACRPPLRRHRWQLVVPAAAALQPQASRLMHRLRDAAGREVLNWEERMDVAAWKASSAGRVATMPLPCSSEWSPHARRLSATAIRTWRHARGRQPRARWLKTPHRRRPEQTRVRRAGARPPCSPAGTVQGRRVQGRTFKERQQSNDASRPHAEARRTRLPSHRGARSSLPSCERPQVPPPLPQPHCSAPVGTACTAAWRPWRRTASTAGGGRARTRSAPGALGSRHAHTARARRCHAHGGHRRPPRCTRRRPHGTPD